MHPEPLSAASGRSAVRPSGTLDTRAALHASARGTVGERRQALRQVARDFEAILVQQMIGAMRRTVGESSLVEKGAGERIFESMLDEEWAKKVSASGGPNSLSEMLYRQLSQQAGLAPETGVANAGRTALPRSRGGSGIEGNQHE
jgi:flagellar protein FlgJ